MNITMLSAMTLLLAAPTAAEGDLDVAMEAFRAGEYARVVEIAEGLPAGTDDYRRGLYLCGEAQLLLHRAEAAERSFTGVLELNPEAAPALVGLGRSLLAQSKLEQAEPHLRAALELDAKSASARRALGEWLVSARKFEEAETLLSKLYREDPTAPLSARALAECHLRAGRDGDAMAVAEAFIQADPRHPVGHFLQAVVLERMGEEDAAIESYAMALKRDERFLDAHKNLAILAHTLSNTYQIQERNDLALAHYARYFELGGHDPALEQTYLSMKKFLTQ